MISGSVEYSPRISWECSRHPGEGVEKLVECRFVDVKIEPACAGEDFIYVEGPRSARCPHVCEFCVILGDKVGLVRDKKDLCTSPSDILCENIIADSSFVDGFVQPRKKCRKRRRHLLLRCWVKCCAGPLAEQSSGVDSA